MICTCTVFLFLIHMDHAVFNKMHILVCLYISHIITPCLAQPVSFKLIDWGRTNESWNVTLNHCIMHVLLSSDNNNSLSCFHFYICFLYCSIFGTCFSRRSSWIYANGSMMIHCLFLFYLSSWKKDFVSYRWWSNM